MTGSQRHWALTKRVALKPTLHSECSACWYVRLSGLACC